MRNFMMIGMVLVSLVLSSCVAQAAEPAAQSAQSGKIQQKHFRREITKTLECDYWLQVPEGYDPTKSYPVMLYLHGAYNMRPEDSREQRIAREPGIRPDLDLVAKNNFILVSPITPDAGAWQGENLEIGMAVLEEFLTNWGGDRNRVYLTGPSAGADACWEFITAHPDLWAAALPLMGPIPSVSRLTTGAAHMPVRTWSGENDTLCRASQVEMAVEALKKAGSNVEFNIMPDTGHGGWEKVWARPDVYDWLLEHTRVTDAPYTGPAVPPAEKATPPADVQAGEYHPRVFKKDVTRTIECDYTVFTPKSYDPAGEKQWPAIFYLHGQADVDDPQAPSRLGPMQMPETYPDFPFLVFAPELPKRPVWTYDNLERVLVFMEAMVEQYRIDPDRIIVTGWGTGGYGAWRVADVLADFRSKRDLHLAGVVPVSSRSVDTRGLIGNYEHTARWVFHGEDDKVVDVREAKWMAKSSGTVEKKATFLPGVGHDAWKQVYTDPKLYSWMAPQRAVRLYTWAEIQKLQDDDAMPESLQAAGPFETPIDADQAAALSKTGADLSGLEWKTAKRQPIHSRRNRIYGYGLLPGFNKAMGAYYLPLSLSGQAGKTVDLYVVHQAPDEASTRLFVEGKEIKAELLKGPLEDRQWLDLRWGQYRKFSFTLPAEQARALLSVPMSANGLLTLWVVPASGDMKIKSP